MDVTNRTIVDTTGLGDDLLFGNGNKDIEFSNDGKKLFIFISSGKAQFHNLATPYDVASISASTLIPDDGLNYTTAYSELLILPFLMELHLVMMEQKCILMMDLKIQ